MTSSSSQNDLDPAFLRMTPLASLDTSSRLMGEQRRVLSFDIGIKNLAYCYLEEPVRSAPRGAHRILDWKILNLMEPAQPATQPQNLIIPLGGGPGGDGHPTCSCHLAQKGKKNGATIPQLICGKKAKYGFKDGTFYCETHAKTRTEVLIPKKTHERSWLNKQSKETLVKIYQDLKIQGSPPTLKKDYIDTLVKYYKENSFENVTAPGAGINCKDLDLVTVGRHMADHLDSFIARFKESPPTHIIIENQISTIASRMKTIQGELTMYFLVHFPKAHIEYISSRNKLKDFVATPNENVDTVTTTTDTKKKGAGRTKKTEGGENTEPQTAGAKYRDHKADAIRFTGQLLKDPAWIPFFTNEKKKKDDLADCFLQGIWYLKNR